MNEIKIAGDRAMELTDNWHVSGQDKEELFRILEDMTLRTGVENDHNLSNIGIWSYSKKTVSSGRPEYTFFRFNTDTIAKAENEEEMFFHKNIRAKNKETIDVMDEVRTGSGMLLEVPGENKYDQYILSRNALSAFAGIIGAKGDAVKLNSFERDLYFAKCCQSYATINNSFDGKCSFLYRVDPGKSVRKIFRVSKGRYQYSPLNTLIPLTDTALMGTDITGKGILKNWDVSHRITTIWVEYPEYADDIALAYGLDKKLIPGISITDSDSGASALIITVTLRQEDCDYPVFIAKDRWQHTKSVPMEEVEAYIRDADSHVAPAIAKWRAQRLPASMKPETALNKLFEKHGIDTAIGTKRTKTVIVAAIGQASDPKSHEVFDLILTEIGKCEDDSQDNRRKRAIALGRLFGLKGGSE